MAYSGFMFTLAISFADFSITGVNLRFYVRKNASFSSVFP